MRGRLATIALVFAVATSGIGACAADAGDLDPMLVDHERDQVHVTTTDGERHRFEVFLATTPAQRSTGLMHVRRLAPDAGMLFLFDDAEPRSFWMKNTPLPLDILFIGRNGVIVNIGHDTVPGSLDSVPSLGRAIAVLELNAGTSRRLGITQGARIEHPFFD